MAGVSKYIDYSSDQIQAYDTIKDSLLESGVDINLNTAIKKKPHDNKIIAIIGKAGSGKTMLLADLVEAVKKSGVIVNSAEYFRAISEESRTLSILAPTNKAASILRNRKVPATTIHRALYTPLYHPDYEKIANWLSGSGKKPEVERFDGPSLDRALQFYNINNSIPGALASIGIKGSDFIKGWKRREEPLDIGFVDEASMLDSDQLKDLSELFNTLILFGDPAQLPSISKSDKMVFESLNDDRKIYLSRVHRQSSDNPILDLAHALGNPQLTFSDFEGLIAEVSKTDSRIIQASRVNADLMSRSPVLVWRNKTRIRLINAYRLAFGTSLNELIPGEPLICDGIELPVKHRKKRVDLEARGLVKGAQVIYLGPGRKTGFSRLHVLGAEDPEVSAASIIKIETNDEEQPFIPFAARMGASFLHGAAITVHKSQGSQWKTVQVFAPDIFAAASSGRIEAGIPLWKRLAYVAVTRAQDTLIWIDRNRLERPRQPLGVEDLEYKV
jgi:exodeoxyribonuclease-5